MRVVLKGFVLFSTLIFLFTLSSDAQQPGRILSMKLLTPEVGWAATSKQLFWTTDGGVQWKDITPKLNHKRQAVSSVFFLDASTGSVLLSCGDDRDPVADDVCFEFASTINAGENWSLVHPKIVDPVPQSVIIEDGQGFSGTTFLDFSDAIHGWAILKRNLHVEASSGEMLRTADGGKTWTQLPKGTLPISEQFHFVTAKDGWIAGGGQPESDLYVTHDGGSSWSQVAIKPPVGIKVEVWPPTENGVWPDYRLPFFENPEHGFLIGRYWDGSRSRSVLFATADIGKTWTFEKMLPSMDGVTTIFRGTIFVISTTKNMDGLTLTRLPLASNASAPTSVTAEIHEALIRHYTLGAGYDALDMIDDARGWLLADELLATTDGGSTWTDISPGGVPSAPPSIRQPTKTLPSQPKGGSPTGPAAQQPASGSEVSTHLGFDKSDVLTQQQMQALMTFSPFYDTYIYLPGSPNRHLDTHLIPAWLSAVENQGWGIIPIWFGLQSSCIINQPKVTQYFGPTVADASTQGAQQADLAVAAAQAFGFGGGIIYTDIENYTVNSTCSPLVQAYVDGFVTEIHVHSGYLIGIYANPGPISSDISNTSVAQADAIWITKSSKPPQVTTWNQGVVDKLWPGQQRMHQFLIDQTGVTWSGVTFSPSVDENIDNGPIQNANNGAKTFSSYTFRSFDYPGATSTIGKGINDIWGGTLINTSGLVGQIVGGYYDSNGIEHGFFFDALVAWTTIDYPGQYSGEAEGINSSGQIVGIWLDNNECSHGYLYTAGAFTSVDNPNANCASGGTALWGINDAGQITGTSCGASGCGSFIYYRNKYYPITYPGATATLANGINGDAMTAGYVGGITSGYTWTGFTESPIPPSWTGSFSS